MARSFNGSSDRAQYSGAVVSATPLTMACWFKPANTTDHHTLMSIATGGSFNNYFELAARGDAVGDPVQVEAYGSGGAGSAAATSAGFSSGVWQHACGVFASTTSRTVYLNGGSSGSDTTSHSPSGMNLTCVGFRGGSAAGLTDAAADIADAAVWNVALTADEIAALADGVSPVLIRPQSLVSYYPLIGRTSPEPDIKGGLGLTLTGTAAADHPRVYRAGRGQRSVFVPTAGGGGGSIIPLVQHLNRMRRVG